MINVLLEIKNKDGEFYITIVKLKVKVFNNHVLESRKNCFRYRSNKRTDTINLHM